MYQITIGFPLRVMEFRQDGNQKDNERAARSSSAEDADHHLLGERESMVSLGEREVRTWQ